MNSINNIIIQSKIITTIVSLIVFAIMIYGSRQDIKKHEIPHRVWIIPTALYFWNIFCDFILLTKFYHPNIKIILLSALVTLITSVFIAMLLLIFAKGLGGGDTKALFSLYLIIGSNISTIYLIENYRSYANASPFNLYEFASIFVVAILLMTMLGFISSLPEFIIRIIKSKKKAKNSIECLDNKSQENNKPKVKVAMMPYITFGYTIINSICIIELFALDKAMLL